MSVVESLDLNLVLSGIRELRKLAILKKIDPWAFRQALIMTLEMDTDAAMKRGIKKQELDIFDDRVRVDVEAYIHG